MTNREELVDGGVAVLIPSLNIATVYGYDSITETLHTLPLLLKVSENGGMDYLEGVERNEIAGVKPEDQPLAWLGICLLLNAVMRHDDRLAERWRDALIGIMPVRHYCIQVLGTKDRPEITIIPLGARTRPAMIQEAGALALKLAFNAPISMTLDAAERAIVH